MRRVLWVSHFLPYPPTGGVLQRGYGLITRLSRHCEIHLLAMHQPRLFQQTGGRTEADKQTAIGELRKFCASVELIDIPAEQHQVGRAVAALRAALTNRSYTQEWLASGEMQRAVARAVQVLQPQIAHFDTISLAPYSRFCGDNVCVSLGHHNIESHMMWRRASNSDGRVSRTLLGLEAKRILELERKYAKAVDLNVVCSELDARRLRRLAGAAQMHVAENGVLDAEVDQATLDRIEQSPARLLFVGRMSAYTNRDAAEFLAREIWPAASAKRPDLTLDIAGSGTPKSALDLATSDRRVKVHGFLPDLSAVLSPGCIFVCPIRDGGGTKLKILDAMNRGLAIVAHPRAMEGIDAKNGEHFLLAETAGQFADAIAELTDSPSLRQRLAQTAFEFVRANYAFDAIAQNLHRRFELLRRDH